MSPTLPHKDSRPCSNLLHALAKPPHHYQNWWKCLAPTLPHKDSRPCSVARSSPSSVAPSPQCSSATKKCFPPILTFLYVQWKYKDFAINSIILSRICPQWQFVAKSRNTYFVPQNIHLFASNDNVLPILPPPNDVRLWVAGCIATQCHVLIFAHNLNVTTAVLKWKICTKFIELSQPRVTFSFSRTTWMWKIRICYQNKKGLVDFNPASHSHSLSQSGCEIVTSCLSVWHTDRQLVQHTNMESPQTKKVK